MSMDVLGAARGGGRQLPALKWQAPATVTLPLCMLQAATRAAATASAPSSRCAVHRLGGGGGRSGGLGSAVHICANLCLPSIPPPPPLFSTSRTGTWRSTSTSSRAATAGCLAMSRCAAPAPTPPSCWRFRQGQQAGCKEKIGILQAPLDPPREHSSQPSSLQYARCHAPFDSHICPPSPPPPGAVAHLLPFPDPAVPARLLVHSLHVPAFQSHGGEAIADRHMMCYRGRPRLPSCSAAATPSPPFPPPPGACRSLGATRGI